MKNIFGIRLEKLRSEKGMYQSDLAELLKVTQGFVSKLEQGIKQPSVEMLINICDILETTPDYLLGYRTDPQTPNNK